MHSRQKISRILVFTLLIAFFASCEKKEEEKYIVKVGTSYLTEEEMNDLVLYGSDSSKFKEEFIRQWIENELLYMAANEKGIIQTKEFNSLIEKSERKTASTLLIRQILAGFVLSKIEFVLKDNKSRSYAYTLKESVLNFHIELIPAQYHLAIYGDNYDVYPLIQLAGLLDWEISLVGNIQKLKKEHLKQVKNIYPKDLIDRPTIDERTAIILMAHDFKTDVKNMKDILHSVAPYIASLGPKKRFEKIKNQFEEEEGFLLNEQDLLRIHAPCGLEIGADSPEEIALSICSEIMTSFTGKDGGMLRNKMSPIHDRS